jgi:large subunit ribosomal protein L24
MAAKIRKGDKVIVIAGRDKGKTGVVTKRVDNANRVFIEGVNMVKKHVKPNPQAQVEGGIVDIEASLHISNVKIFNPMTNKGDRVRFKFIKDGDGDKKVRCFVSNGEMVDV